MIAPLQNFFVFDSPTFSIVLLQSFSFIHWFHHSKTSRLFSFLWSVCRTYKSVQDSCRQRRITNQTVRYCGGFDLGWMPDIHQAALPLLSLAGQGKKKHNKRLVSHGQNRL